MRLLGILTNQEFTAKVYHASTWDEIQVRFYDGDQKLPVNTYFTGYHRHDKASKASAIQDATNTACRELEQLVATRDKNFNKTLNEDFV
jgi:hypothetical protein